MTSAGTDRRHPLEKLSAAIDGELDHDTRDKVFGHLVGCPSCRAEAEDERRLKARLGLLEGPEPSLDLTQRLLAIPEFSSRPREELRPLPPVTQLAQLTPGTRLTLSPARSAFPAAPANRPATRPAARPSASRRRGVVVGAAGSAAALASLLGTAFVIGDPHRPPALQPPVSSFSADHATSTNGNPFGDPAAMLTSFNSPGSNGFSLLQPVVATGR